VISISPETGKMEDADIAEIHMNLQRNQ
jgi:hypothetical protein